MRAILLFLFFHLICFGASAQQQTKPRVEIVSDSFRIVEASCGQCKFGMKAKGCNLAIRFDGKPYFIDGTKIDDHGDAHADDGFCNKIRQAKVSGSVVNGRFLATSFKLLPEAKAKP